MKSMVKKATLALGASAALAGFVAAAPAEARYHGGYGGGHGYHGGYGGYRGGYGYRGYGHHGIGTGGAIALGLGGVALGAALADSGPRYYSEPGYYYAPPPPPPPPVYYGYGYYPRAYGYYGY